MSGLVIENLSNSKKVSPLKGFLKESMGLLKGPDRNIQLGEGALWVELPDLPKLKWVLLVLPNLQNRWNGLPSILEKNLNSPEKNRTSLP